MTVAVVDLSTMKLTVAGVGNVETHLWSGGREQHLVTQRGMLGATLPKLRPVEIQLSDNWILVLHSDGIKARFSLGSSEGPLLRSDPQALADSILAQHRRPDDDATVLVAAPRL